MNFVRILSEQNQLWMAETTANRTNISACSVYRIQTGKWKCSRPKVREIPKPLCACQLQREQSFQQKLWTGRTERTAEDGQQLQRHGLKMKHSTVATKGRKWSSHSDAESQCHATGLWNSPSLACGLSGGPAKKQSCLQSVLSERQKARRKIQGQLTREAFSTKTSLCFGVFR